MSSSLHMWLDLPETTLHRGVDSLAVRHMRHEHTRDYIFYARTHSIMKATLILNRAHHNVGVLYLETTT